METGGSGTPRPAEGVPPETAVDLQEVTFTVAHRSLTLVTQHQAKKTDGLFGRTAVCRGALLRGGIHQCDFTVLKGRKLVVGVCKSTYDPHRGPRATHSPDGWGCHTLGGDFCHGLADGSQAWPKWPGQAGAKEGDKLGLRVDLLRGCIDVFKNNICLGTMVASSELVGQDVCWMVEIEGVGDAVCVGLPVDPAAGQRQAAPHRTTGRIAPAHPLRRRLERARGLGLPPVSAAITPTIDANAARLAEAHPQWVCPITGELMVDPVVDPEGHTWERHAVVRWLELSQTSPLTRSPCEFQLLRKAFSAHGQLHNRVHYTRTHMMNIFVCCILCRCAVQVQDLTADEEMRLAIVASQSERDGSSAESAAACADVSVGDRVDGCGEKGRDSGV